MVRYTIGAQIKQRRLELGISQEQLALLAGVTPTYLGQTERGERNPTIGFLEKVASALRVDIAYFFSERTEKHSPSEARILYTMSELEEKDKAVIADLVQMVVSARRAEKEN